MHHVYNLWLPILIINNINLYSYNFLTYLLSSFSIPIFTSTILILFLLTTIKSRNKKVREWEVIIDKKENNVNHKIVKINDFSIDLTSRKTQYKGCKNELFYIFFLNVIFFIYFIRNLSRLANKLFVSLLSSICFLKISLLLFRTKFIMFFGMWSSFSSLIGMNLFCPFFNTFSLLIWPFLV